MQQSSTREVGKEVNGGKAKLQIGANQDQNFTIEIQDMRAAALRTISAGADADSSAEMQHSLAQQTIN